MISLAKNVETVLRSTGAAVWCFSSAELDSAAGGFMERESVPRAESG